VLTSPDASQRSGREDAAVCIVPTTITTTCCIVGGGPAGIVLGVLLARAGVDVVVLEKHADFLRDFRGDTLHPSTLELVYELGWIDDLLRLPHQKAPVLQAQIGNTTFAVADFTRLPTHCKFLAFMPQWDFLNFFAEHGARYPTFALRMRAQAHELIEASGRIVGVRAATTDGPLEVRAALVVGCDGRHSLIRARAGLEVEEFGAPMDVLWFHLPMAPNDLQTTTLRFDAGRLFIMIRRETQWQCGYVIPKGSFAQIQSQGLDAFRASVSSSSPFSAERTASIRSWDDVKLLTVQVDRLRRWFRPGLLCIGDSAHAMSPVGGVGINLAIQDAVATANELAAVLRDGGSSDEHLPRVQQRREPPTQLTQRAQVFVANRVISRMLAGTGALRPPLILKLLDRFPLLRRVPGRLLGLGVRPEHVQTPDAYISQS
jgi:2-polyprenyl-6-methoxyphenol hydroxylase-like FAD-dependent oxidoreductase